MKQFEVDDNVKVPVDYTDPGQVIAARGTRGRKFFLRCARTGCHGWYFRLRNHTDRSAWDWDKHLEDFKKNREEDDEVALYIESKFSNLTDTDELLAVTGSQNKDTPEISFETPHAKGLA